MPTSNTPQVAINDIGTAEDFLAAVDATIKYFNDGDIVEGTVVKVDHDEVLLDIGYKTEGVIPSRELSIKHDVNPDEVVEVGDEIDALVLTKEDKEGRLILSKKRAQYERAWGAVEELHAKEEPVTGTVIEVVKGGLILDIGLRGFLPASLVEMRRVRDLEPYIGQELEAKIIERTSSATTLSCPAAHTWSRPSPRSVPSSCTSCRRVRSARALFLPSSTSVPSSISAESTAWFTFPSCPGSTSITHLRLSPLVTR